MWYLIGLVCVQLAVFLAVCRKEASEECKLKFYPRGLYSSKS